MWRLCFPIVSLLLMEAHFLFNGYEALLPLPAALALFLLVPYRWVKWLEVGFLVFFGVEWVRTALRLVNERMAEGRPYTLACVILLVCAVYTLASAWAFFHGQNQGPLQPLKEARAYLAVSGLTQAL